MKFNYFYLLVILFSLNSCITASKLDEYYSSKKHKLGVLLDNSVSIPPDNTIDSKKKLKIDINFKDSLSLETSVVNTKYVLIPTPIVFAQSQEYLINLGEESLEDKFTKYYKDVTLDYFKRYSEYSIVDNNKSEYRLEINIDSVSSTGYYSSDESVVFLFFIAISKEEYLADRCKAEIYGDYKLFKKDSLYIEETFEIEYSDLFPSYYTKNSKYINNEKIYGFITNNLSESLSQLPISVSKRILSQIKSE